MPNHPATTPPDHESTLSIPKNVHLGYLGQPTHQRIPSPAEKFSPTSLRVATRFQDHPHQIAASWVHSTATTVEVKIWGSHAAELSLLVADLLSFNDTTADSFSPQQAPVAEWLRKSPGLRLSKNLSVFDTLIPIVLAQRIVGKEAKNIHRRMYRLASEDPPGPAGLRVPPAPSNLRQIGYERWHQMGLERSRARTIHECARIAPRIESWRDLDVEELYSNLVSIPRIGPWTANRVLYAMGHADAVCIGDYNLPSLVAWNLRREPRADDARMLELLEPYRGHRARVLRLMELHGTTPPRFGPRLALRNIQRH